MDIGKLLCKLGMHKWGKPKADVIRGTEYTKVCERCQKLQ